MVVKVTLSEVMVNAIGRALINQQRQDAAELAALAEFPESKDREYAMECRRDAIRDTIAVQLTIASAASEDYPANMTVATLVTESELRLLDGNR